MTEITILNLLSTKPMYGAEMIDEIKRLSGNTVIMSLPTLYSSLHRLAKKEYVRSYQKESAIGGRCRVYNITNHGREYLAQNPIKIDYQQIAEKITNNTNNTTNSQPVSKTFSSLEEAFSLPLNKNQIVPPELPEDKRILQITPTPEPTTMVVPKPTPKQQPKSTTNKVESKTSLYAPYIAPNEKITATPEPQYQQTMIGLSGTTGGNDLRPLLKLNSIAVGNDYVMINRLRIVATALTTVIFLLINLFCSLTHTVQQECYSLVYIALILYLLIWAAIYLVYPRIKAVYKIKPSAIRQTITTVILTVLVVVLSIIAQTTEFLWLLLFTIFPLIEFVFMVTLRKRSLFAC